MNRKLLSKIGYGAAGLALALILILGATDLKGAFAEFLNSLIGLLMFVVVASFVLRAVKYPIKKKSVTRLQSTTKSVAGTVEIITRVAGVTFKNDDGSDRQEIIGEMRDDEDIELEPYLYKGDPAVYVKNSSGEIIGNVPREYTPRIYKAIKEGRCNGASINAIYPAGDKPAGVSITVYMVGG